MTNILIFGAGSIGNHFANASIKLSYNVYITDISSYALTRMKKKFIHEDTASGMIKLN